MRSSIQQISTRKFKMGIRFVREYIFEIITKTPPTPIITDWSKKYRKSRAIINLNIYDNQNIHVNNIQNARNTWNTLISIHDWSNLSSKFYLLRKLYSTKFTEGADMAKLYTNILGINDKQSALGKNIRGNHISTLLLYSLPPSLTPS